MVCLDSGKEDRMYAVQEVVEWQNVNSHTLFPSLLIWIICILSGVYKFLSGSVRFLVHKLSSKKSEQIYF